MTVVKYGKISKSSYADPLCNNPSHKESRATLACLYRTSGRFYMLQLNSVDSGHFTKLELSTELLKRSYRSTM